MKYLLLSVLCLAACGGGEDPTDPTFASCECDPGLDGADGLQGDIGEQGPPGEKGDKGEPGDDGAQGLPGEKGDPGDDGAQGVQGEQGTQGTQGVQGEQGAQGDDGDPGPGTRVVYSGLTGSDGTASFDLDIDPDNMPMIQPFYYNDDPSAHVFGAGWFLMGFGINDDGDLNVIAAIAEQIPYRVIVIY